MQAPPPQWTPRLRRFLQTRKRIRAVAGSQVSESSFFWFRAARCGPGPLFPRPDVGAHRAGPSLRPWSSLSLSSSPSRVALRRAESVAPAPLPPAAPRTRLSSLPGPAAAEEETSLGGWLLCAPRPRAEQKGKRRGGGRRPARSSRALRKFAEKGRQSGPRHPVEEKRRGEQQHKHKCRGRNRKAEKRNRRREIFREKRRNDETHIPLRVELTGCGTLFTLHRRV